MANAAPCAAADAQTPITQIDFARAGVVTPQMAAVAAAEGREPEAVRAAVVSAIFAADDIEAATRELSRIIDETLSI